jgi:hypothetical protein
MDCSVIGPSHVTSVSTYNATVRRLGQVSESITCISHSSCRGFLPPGTWTDEYAPIEWTDPYHTMPLKCLSPQGKEYAFRHTGESWAELKAANATNKHLRMDCCGAQVVLKRSNRGTRFFAHARRGPCSTAPESAEHLLAKDIIARAAEAAGWNATTEERGTSPSGKGWIADVLCGKSQNAEETEARQGIYKKSGVRGLWLMRQPVIPRSQSTPAFQLHVGEQGGESSRKTSVGRLRGSPNQQK